MTNAYANSLGLGDFNHDGNLDLTFNDFLGENIGVILGRGDGTFLPRKDYAATKGLTSLATGDVNGDGNLDIVAQGGTSYAIVVLLGIGDGTFGDPHLFGLNNGSGGSDHSVGFGDFNLDGKLDVVISNPFDRPSAVVSVFPGNGDGKVNAQADFRAVRFPGSLVVSDFNGDGKPDVAVVDLYGWVSVFLNTSQ